MTKEPDLRAWLTRADELGAKGAYFEAHEELEAGWMKASGMQKVLLQGLIQIAAGLHRLKNDPAKTDGAMYLLERGQEKLEKSALLTPGSLSALKNRLVGIRASKAAPPTFVFGLHRR